MHLLLKLDPLALSAPADPYPFARFLPAFPHVTKPAYSVLMTIVSTTLWGSLPHS